MITVKTSHGEIMKMIETLARHLVGNVVAGKLGMGSDMVHAFEIVLDAMVDGGLIERDQLAVFEAGTRAEWAEIERQARAKDERETP
jgi:hypothetical protein